MIGHTQAAQPDTSNHSPDDADMQPIFSAFGEAMLVIGPDRSVIRAMGDCDRYFSRAPSACIGVSWEALISACADPDHKAPLYWAVEALLEGYVVFRFLPARFPFREIRSVQFAMLDAEHVAVRGLLDSSRAVDSLIHDQVQLALHSTVGFADVILKGIGGPLTDIQIEDMEVIRREAQFALDLTSDLRALYLVPNLQGPIPRPLEDLLTLSGDDLPQRQLATQHLELRYQFPESIQVYSNGAIRACVACVVRLLTQHAQRHTQILISAQPETDHLIVSVTYTADDFSMQVPRRIDPTPLSHRKQIEQDPLIYSVISSLHAYLSPTGCTVWADSGNGSGATSSVISMTVPLWRGPTVSQENSLDK